MKRTPLKPSPEIGTITRDGARQPGGRAIGRRVWRRPVARHRGALRDTARAMGRPCATQHAAPPPRRGSTHRADRLCPCPPCAPGLVPLRAARLRPPVVPAPPGSCAPRARGAGVRGRTRRAALRQAPHHGDCERHDHCAGHHRACLPRVRQRKSPLLPALRPALRVLGAGLPQPQSRPHPASCVPPVGSRAEPDRDWPSAHAPHASSRTVRCRLRPHPSTWQTPSAWPLRR